MIIDMHCHSSSRPLWGLHVTSATIADLEQLAKKYGISLIALMVTCFPEKNKPPTNLQMLEKVDDNPLFIVFVTLDATGDIAPWLAEIRSLALARRIGGIKLYAGYQDFEPDEYKMFAVYELAEEFNLPVVFHTGELQICCPREDYEAGVFRCGKDHCPLDIRQDLSRPSRIAGAVRCFPRVKFVLSHLGNPYFEELRELMSECPNVYTDISGQFLSKSSEDTPEYRQLIVEEIRKFLALPNGIDRILFGTDFPIQSHEDSIALVKSLGLSAADEAKIFFKNAQFVLDTSKEVIHE